MNIVALIVMYLQLTSHGGFDCRTIYHVRNFRNLHVRCWALELFSNHQSFKTFT